MEVQLTPDLQAKLTRMAEQQGRDHAALITEAVERLVNHDARFSSKAEIDPYWEQEEHLVASGAMKMPQEEMDWKRFFAHPQTATVSDEAAIQAVIDICGDR